MNPSEEKTSQHDNYNNNITEVDPSLLASMHNLSFNTPGVYDTQSQSGVSYVNLNYVYNHLPTITNNNVPPIQGHLTFALDLRGINNLNSSNSSHFSPHQHENKLVLLAKDSYHSLSLLEYFKDSNPQIKHKIVDNVIGHLHEISVHKVGCNFITRLFHDCDQDLRRRIVLALASHTKSLVPLACHLHGTHVIQKIIRMGKKLPEIGRFPSAFADYIVYMMMDRIGRHVLQQCFVLLDTSKNKGLYEALLGNWWKLAMDKQGCVALNECMWHLDSSYKYCLLHCICAQAATLSQDTYGTHVVQNILDMKMPIFAKEIVTQLKTLYERLSTTQRGSYIVEKCLKTQYMPLVVKELLLSPKLVMLAQDQYGNFVIQEALRQTKERESVLYQQLCRELCQELGNLESGPYGRNVVKLLKLNNNAKIKREEN